MIYLDSAATTRPSRVVKEKVTWAMEHCFANPSSLHRLGFQSEKAVREAREAVAAVLGVSAERVIFTSGGTESNQLAICGALAGLRGKGAVLIPETEHSSVFDVPIAAERIRRIPVDSLGHLDYERIRQILRSEPVDLITAMLVNNEIGTISSPKRIRAILKETGSEAFFHIDGVQAYGKIDIQEAMESADSFALSGHKIHALKGIGALYARDWSRIRVRQPGGQQEFGHRAGTENLTGILSLGAAAQALPRAGILRTVSGSDPSAAKQELVASELKLALIRALDQIGTAYRINGDPQNSSDYILSLSFAGIKSEVLVHMLETHNIYVSTRSACSTKKREMSRVLRAIGLGPSEAEGTIRVSFGTDPAAESGIESGLQERVELVREGARAIANAVEEIRRLTGKSRRRR